MEEIPSPSGASETESSDVSWWNPDFMQKLKSVALVPQEEWLHTSNSTYVEEYEVTSPHAASQILWETGVYSGQIPNGFYAVIPDKKLKKLFGNIPSSDDIQSLGLVGHRTEMILVDAERDKKLSMLKQLSAALVKGQSSNPASVIKKIAGLVSDVYKRPSSELSPAKASMDETSLLSDNKGPQLLGQIRHGSCWPRALLFKVLADAAGLESKLMVGLPSDENFEWVDSYKHLSVVVMLNATELFVDLMRFPGQLIPFSTKAFFLSHISTAGESDSAENDSCDSPLEPNSPLCGFTDRPDALGHEQDENPYSPSPQRMEASSNIAGPSLRNVTLRSSAIAEGKLSSSHSESNIANALWRRSRRKVISEQRTASSSPEHPLLRARARSMLGGDRHPLGDYVGMEVSRSDGARPSESRRPRRRSISITPEIGDDIVRAVKAMNETLKQNRLLSQSNENLGPHSAAEKKKHEQNVSREDLNVLDQMSSSMLGHSRNQISSEQKSSSLPSSPHDPRCESSNRNGDNLLRTEDCASTWNKVLQSSQFLNQPLLLYEEWYIDFSELTVGTRVGIGSFGEIFRGIWNGTDVAIKIFLEQDLTAENMEDFCNEISILSRLRHPNVILFLGACTKPPHLSMVTEFMERGSLYYLIHISGQKRGLSWRRRLKMLRDICRGLMCIHRMKIVHRDIKSANCLVNKHWAVKICDFGLSRVMTDVPMKDNSSAGTPEWMAPELIRQEPFTEKCDIFSLGVIMWELCTLNRPWQGTPPVQVIYAVANEGAKLEIPEGPLGKLIADCWAEPNERPSCEEILSRLLDCEYTLC